MATLMIRECAGEASLLTDPRKADIKIGQLLAVTASMGIRIPRKLII